MEATEQAHTDSQSANPVIAVSALVKEGDPKNRILLTEQSLHVYYKGKGRAFSLEYLQRLALEHRKLWFPLIGGGILASLCLLALLHTFNMPYRLLSGVVAGLLGVWWGYRGSMALVVYEQRHHTDFLLKDIAPNLPVFLAFANRLIKRYPQSLGTYCIQLQDQEWEQLQRSGSLVLASSLQAIPQEFTAIQAAEMGKRWIAFDPFRLGSRLRWSLREHELVAHVSGTIYVHEVWPR